MDPGSDSDHRNAVGVLYEQRVGSNNNNNPKAQRERKAEGSPGLMVLIID